MASMTLEEIDVLIICTVFNHGRFLRSALEGFVGQETTCKYKVIVHDDCSSDNCKEIINEFATKYPSLIIPIFEQENLYSKGISFANEIFIPFISKRFNVKYIALCEGDDFWTDNKKIQKQFNALEREPSCCFCSHYVSVETDGKIVGFYPSRKIKGGVYRNGASLSLGYLQTSSYFARYKSYVDLNEFRKLHGFNVLFRGSEFNLLFYETTADIVFLDDVMSVYRFNTPGSWSSQHNNVERIIEEERRGVKMLESYNELTSFSYNERLRKRILEKKYRILFYEGKFLEMTKGKNREIFMSKPLKHRFYVFLRAHFPLFFRK